MGTRDNRAGREVIDPDALTFTDDAPPPVAPPGSGYSPLAKIVKALMDKPGRWATFDKSSRKAENIHRKHAGVERRADTAKDQLWLRFVTPEIIAAEAIHAARLDGDDQAIVKAVIDATRKAGENSAKYNDDKTLKLTEYFVPAMQDAAKVACIGIRQEADAKTEA